MELHITGDPAADKLLSEDAFALLTGMLLDQQVTMELAFAGPEKIRTRKAKMGFSSPMPDWFNGPLGEWVAAEVQTPSFLDSDLWNGPIIRDYVRERQARRDWTLENAQRVWRFVQAHLWRQSAFGA